MKFIHVTDTHLVTPREKLKGLDPAERFAACIDSINQNHGDAECMVITGDLADRGEEAAYEFLAAQLDRCALKTYLMLGNHDDRQRFQRWFPDTPVDKDGFTQYIWESQEGVFLFLDTLKQGTHSGDYCEIRRGWLKKMLAHYRNEPVYLFMHHPPFNLHLPCIDRIGLQEQEDFAKIVRPYDNIRHLFFGHAHRPLSGNWRGISFSSLRGTNHQVGLQFHSEQIDYVDEPPEYSVVFLSKDQVVVHTHAYTLNQPLN
jgi:3',5'-cyclic AMP phosphodiesterase CpdA